MMAFGAKIKLSVNTSGASAFRSEIQKYVNTATSSKPIKLKNFSVNMTKEQQTKIVRDIQTYLSGDTTLTLKIGKIDATGAVNKLRQQLQTMLSGLSITGLKEFLGESNIDKITQDIDKAKQSASQWAAQMRVIDDIQKRLGSTYRSALSGSQMVGDATQVQQITAAYTAWQVKVEELRNTKVALSAEELQALQQEGIALQQKITLIQEEQSATAQAAAQEEISDRKKLALAQQQVSLKSQVQRYITSNSKAYKVYGDELDGIMHRLQNESSLTDEQLKQIRKRFYEIQTSAKAAGMSGNTFLDTMKKGFAKFGGWSLITRTLMAVYRIFTNMITAVKELDAAMTELRKVTDLSERSYREYLVTAQGLSEAIGATLADTVNATADFARLGYNLADSTALAEAALVYKNVGDGIEDIGTASESLISTIKAFEKFGESANNAMSIIDRFNEVGNNFAISSEGIGSALQRSASSLAAAGNTLNQSIALVTGMNAVVQDPEKVGTALKTISMYLRAAKTEAEEAGESTEGMANSVSELRSELLTLTKGKVDIMLDDKTFKSTYEIMKDLSKAWNDLADIDQANILELIGGKRNANAVTSLLTNFEDAEKALQTASQASGSALAENEKYLDSIAGKLSVFQSNFETFSTNLIDSSVVKFVVDFGSVLLTILDTLNRIHLLLPLIAVTIAVIVGHINANKMAMLVQQILIQKNAIIAEKATSDQLAVSLAGLNAQQRKLLLTELDRAVANGILTTEERAQIVSTLGLAAAEGTLTIANKGLAASFKSLMASIPVLGWIALGISVVIEAITLLSSSIESSEDRLDRLSQEYSDITSKISSLNSELETTRDRIAELESKGSLTIVEQNELEKLKETNAELSRQVTLYERQQKLKAADVSKAFVDSVDGWKKGTVVNKAKVNDRGIINDGREIQPEYSFYLDREKAFAYYLKLYKNNKDYDKFQEDSSVYNLSKQHFEIADEQLSEFMDTIDEYQEKVKDVDYKYLSDDAKELYDYTLALQDYYLLATATTAEDIQVVFDAIYNGERFAKAKEEIEAFGEKGKLTAEKLRELYENNDDVKQMVDHMAEIGLIDLSKPYAAFKGLAEQLNVVKPEVEETAETIAKSIDEITEKIDSIQEKYKTVLSVFNDYQENGFLSLDNIQSLLALDTKYLQLLTDEGGQLKLNADAFWKLIDAELTELELKKARELLPSIKTMSLEEAQAYATARAVDVQTESTNSLIEAMIREEMLQAVIKDQQNNTNVFTNAVKASLSPMTTVVSLIEQARENYKQYGSAMLDSSNATNKQTDALEKQKEALEDNKKSLEKEKELLEDRADSISDLVDLVTDMITKTKELEKEAFEEEKERIDELIEKQKELLESKKDNADFDRELADKQKSVATNAIAAAVASLDTSSAGKKAFKEASDNLEESKNDLSEYLADHEYEVRIDALDKLKDESDKYYDERIDAIDKYLDDERKLYEDACKAIDNDNGTLYNKLLTYVRTYTTKSDAEFNRLWTKAQEGIQAYSDKNLALIDLIGYLKDGIYQTEDAIDGLSKSIDTISDSIDNMSNKVGSNLSDGINDATAALSKFKDLYDQFDKAQKEAEDKYKSIPLWIFEENGKRYYSSMSDRGAAANQIAGQIEKETGYYRTDIISGLTKINPNEIKWFFTDGNNVYYSTLSDRNKAAVDIGSQVQKTTGYYRPDIISGIKAYASGTKSAQGGLSLVGEKGAEFRVLNQGDGIITSKLTERLIQLGTNPVEYLKHAYSKVFEQLSSQRMMSDTIENMFGNIRNIPISTGAIMQNGTIAPSIQINIQGDATQSTVNALKAQASRIVDMAVNKTMNTALKYSNKPRIN